MAGRALVIALEGPSGAGKSTVCDEVVRRAAWAPLAEAFDRLRPRPSLALASPAALRRLESALLEEDGRRFRAAQALAARGHAVLADTGFLGPVTYTAGLLLLGKADAATYRAVAGRAAELARRGRLGLPDLTVQLATRRALRRERVARDALRHPSALRARHEQVGRLEVRLLTRTLGRAYPGRLRVVPAAGSLRTVVDRVRVAARGMRPLADPCAAALRTLTALERVPSVQRALAARGKVKKGTPSPPPSR